jgi:hypothetical protein
VKGREREREKERRENEYKQTKQISQSFYFMINLEVE